MGDVHTGASNHMEVSNIWRHPNILGVTKHMGDIQTYRGHSCMPFYPTKQVSPLVLLLRLDTIVCLYRNTLDIT